MNKKTILYIGIALAALLIAAITFSIFQVTSLKQELNAAQLDNQQLQLTNEQLSLSQEFDAINSEFAHYENQAVQLANDTILAKYTAAKNKIENLIKELNSEKTKSQARIKQLQDEIATLRGLLRHYIAQVDSLGKENAGLRAENNEIKSQNKELVSQVTEVSQRNEQLNERITLAEKLNVTGVSLQALNKRGKNEKHVTKARQLLVTFTIPQNNSTPPGQKTIFMRITSPEGTLLGNAGVFPFEGASLTCTEKKKIDYEGSEIPGIQIYWDVNTTLTPGEYTVELFTEGYRLCSRHFTLKK